MHPDLQAADGGICLFGGVLRNALLLGDAAQPSIDGSAQRHRRWVPVALRAPAFGHRDR